LFNLKSKKMINEKSLRNAAKELQEVMGLEPALDIKAKLPVLAEQVKEAIKQIDPAIDTFTDETQVVIDELGGAEEEEAPTPKKKVAGKKAPEPVEEEEEEEEEETEADTLEEQIEAAIKLSELTAIVKANGEFKSLRAKLSGYTKASQLKAAMVTLLAPEEEEEEEEAPPAKMAKKIANAPIRKPAVEEEEEEEPKPKKAAGKKPNFVKAEFTRGDAVCEIIKSGVKVKTREEVAVKADALFVKKGGSANIKETRAQAKKILPALAYFDIEVPAN
jgi:hypothetical protein